MSHSAELCVDSHSILGEGPVWDDEEQILYWVDIIGHKEELAREPHAGGLFALESGVCGIRTPRFAG